MPRAKAKVVGPTGFEPASTESQVAKGGAVASPAPRAISTSASTPEAGARVPGISIAILREALHQNGLRRPSLPRNPGTAAARHKGQAPYIPRSSRRSHSQDTNSSPTSSKLGAPP